MNLCWRTGAQASPASSLLIGNATSPSPVFYSANLPRCTLLTTPSQRAFRQRKETYIKKLEDDVRNASALPALQENLQRVQQENFHMRDYIMALQSRLLEVTGEFPPPPPTLELRDPRSNEPIRTAPREVPDGQGGPPPRPQMDSGPPVAGMGLIGMQEGGAYPDAGADGKTGEASAYPSYDGPKIERPNRPGPPPEGGQQVVN